jgi:transaldolase
MNTLKIKIFADGADIEGIRRLAARPEIAGFTTNPTLMRTAGVVDYESFAHEVLGAVGDRPVSFEVFSDDFDGMESQALAIAGWGRNVNVKIPVTTTTGAFCGPVIGALARAGVTVNVTAVMTLEQVRAVAAVLPSSASAIVSVFAGRIADTGRDPVPMMAEALRILAARPQVELLWASPREVLNVFQADAVGCHIITVTADLLGKLASVGKDLDQFSLETVRMFHRDAAAAGYAIGTEPRRLATG